MKIVLTGGPSAGKTSIVEILYKSNSEKTVVVQEAASLLYRGGFPRAFEPKHVQSQQYAIYAVQSALEEIALEESGGRTIVCDRGSLDGLAYWFGTKESFFEKVSSSMQKEIDRYNWVIHLDSASGYNYKNSATRPEKIFEAEKINELVKIAWSEHPNRLIIPNSAVFLKKVEMVLHALSLILQKKSAPEIRILMNIE